MDLEQLARLTAGANPQWAPTRNVDTPDVRPTLQSDGVQIAPSLVTQVAVDLGGSTTATVWVTITNIPTETEISVAINSSPVGFTAAGDETLKEALELLRDAVLADGQVDGAFIAGDELVITYDSGLYLVEAAAETELVREATAATVELWVRSVGQSRWRRIEGGVFELEQSWIENVRTSGVERLMVRVTATDGRARVNVGPCR